MGEGEGWPNESAKSVGFYSLFATGHVLCSKKVVLRGRGDTQVHSLSVFTVLRGPRATRPEGGEIETNMTKSEFFIEFS